MLTATILSLALAQPAPETAWYSDDLLLRQLAKLEAQHAYPAKWFHHDRAFVVAPSRLPESVRHLADLNLKEAMGDRAQVAWSGRHTVEERFADVVVGTLKLGAETVQAASHERVLTLLVEGKRTTTLATAEDAMRFANAAIERVIQTATVNEAQLTHNLAEHDANLYSGTVYRRSRRVVEDDGRVRLEGDSSFGAHFHVATNGRSVLIVAVLPTEGGQQGMHTGPHVCSLVPRS